MSRLRIPLTAALVVILAGLFPGLAQAAFKAYLKKDLSTPAPKADQIVVYVAFESSAGFPPSGQIDGVIAVSHEAINRIISLGTPLGDTIRSAQGAATPAPDAFRQATIDQFRFRNPRVVAFVVDRAELTRAGLTNPSPTAAWKVKLGPLTSDPANGALQASTVEPFELVSK